MKLTRIYQDNRVHIDWQMFSVCNFNCIYCRPDLHDNAHKMCDLDTAVAVVERLSKHWPDRIVQLQFTGGEPTAWNEFGEFLQIIKTRFSNIVTEVYTNGYRDQFFIDYSQYVDSMIFSFHPTMITRTSTVNFDRLIRNINNCKTWDKSIISVAYPPVWDWVIESYNEFKERVDHYNLLRLKVCDTRADDPSGAQARVYTKEQFDFIWFESGHRKITQPDNTPTYMYVNPWEETIDVDIDDTRQTVEAWSLFHDGVPNFQGWKCNVGVEKLCFQIDGKVTRGSACFFEESLGDWKTNNFVIPSESVTCPYNKCGCWLDLRTNKWK